MLSSLKEAYAGKKVLVTGDTGFKGSWLSIWLKEVLDADVAGIGLPPETQRDNYNICDLGEKIGHYDCDIRDKKNLEIIFEKEQPEFVFHLAAQPLVLESYKNPLSTFEINVTGTLNILENIRHSDSVKSGVIVTSDKCYENKEWIYGYRENDRIGGKDPYSASKAAAEIVSASYIHSFFSESDSPGIASVRAGNVFGGGDWANNRIIPDCLRSFEKGIPVKIRNPDSVRPWQHVLEPLSGYLILGAQLAGHGKEYSGAWNFGPMHSGLLNVKNLVELFIHHYKKGSFVINKDEPGKESGYLMLDSTKAYNFLKWKPVWNLDRALEYTAKEYNVNGMTKEEIYRQRCDHIQKFIQDSSYIMI